MSLLSIAVCLWLLACAICDLQWRAVPAWLSLPPLFGAVLWVALKGKFALALFVLLLFILADIPVRMRGFANGLQVGIFCLGVVASADPIAAGISMLSMLLIWTIWQLEKMGGADAQVLMVLTLIFGPPVLLPIMLAGGLQGLLHRLFRQKSMPFMVSILAGSLFHFLYPGA